MCVTYCGQFCRPLNHNGMTIFTVVVWIKPNDNGCRTRILINTQSGRSFKENPDSCLITLLQESIGNENTWYMKNEKTVDGFFSKKKEKTQSMAKSWARGYAKLLRTNLTRTLLVDTRV